MSYLLHFTDNFENPSQEITVADVTDKRLLVTEGEFASVLRILGRDGNPICDPMARVGRWRVAHPQQKLSSRGDWGAHLDDRSHQGSAGPQVPYLEPMQPGTV